MVEEEIFKKSPKQKVVGTFLRNSTKEMEKKGNY